MKKGIHFGFTILLYLTLSWVIFALIFDGVMIYSHFCNPQLGKDIVDYIYHNLLK